MIKKFQMLFANEELFLKIIDHFHYLIAIISPQYILKMVNKAFVEETKIQFTDLENGIIHIPQYKIKDIQLSVALMKVFEGDSFFLESLKNPFYNFSGIAEQYTLTFDRFNKVIISPVPADDGKVNNGMIMFMP